MSYKNISNGAVATLIALAAYGCHGSGHDDSGAKPILAAFNAAPDLPDVTFLREEEVWASMAFGIGTAFRSVDADQYDLNFDALLPGDKTTLCSGDVDKDEFKDTNECTRLSSSSINAVEDHEYIVALVGKYNALNVKVYDDGAHEFDTRTDDGDAADLNAQVQFFNWTEALGAVDVYLEPPGTNFSVTQARATLAAGEEFNGLVDEGSYVLTLTAVANPNAPVYTSESFTLAKQTRVAFGILDGTSDGTSAVRVSRFRDQGGDLLDRRVKTLLRVAHVAPDTGNVDVYAEQNYTAPLFANLTLQQSSPYTEIDSTAVADLELDVTPAGNVGVLLTREQTTLTKGSRSTLFLVKSSTGQLDGLKSQEGARRIAPYAQLRLANSVPAGLDFYVIPHGSNVYTSTPNQTLSGVSIGGSQSFAPGDYDVVIARAGTDTYVFGPRAVPMAGNGIYTLVAVPTADTTRAAVLLLDDFAH